MRVRLGSVPRPPPAPLPIAGDSMTAGAGLAPDEIWAAQMVAALGIGGYRATFYNGGHNGENSADMLVHQTDEILSRFNTTGRWTRAHLLGATAIEEIGSNDLSQGVSEATLRAHQTTWIANCRAAGFGGVGLSAILHRTGSLGVSQATFDAGLAANNGYWRTQVGILIDFFIDAAEDPRLVNPANTTYFQGDRIHLTAAGARVLGVDYGVPTLATFINST